MGFAEPVIGRAFERPVGSTHPAIVAISTRRANHLTSLYQKHVKPSREKCSSSVFRKIVIVSAHPASTRRGVSRSSRHARRGAMDARGPTDERHAGGRAKSRGPDLPTLRSSRRKMKPSATEAKEPGTPGRARISRKPLRREGRCFGVPVAFLFEVRAAGATCIRLSLRPLFRGSS
jgi:hypothetical protein